MLIDVEYELRTTDQSRFTVDGIPFHTVEGQACINHVFQESLGVLDIQLFDTGALIAEETTNVPSLPFCLLV